MAVEHGLVEPDVLFIDGTHMKASANKNKHHKELIEVAAKQFASEIDEDINALREELEKKPFEEKKVTPIKFMTASDTDPDAGMFCKTDKRESIRL